MVVSQINVTKNTQNTYYTGDLYIYLKLFVSIWVIYFNPFNLTLLPVTEISEMSSD